VSNETSRMLAAEFEALCGHLHTGMLAMSAPQIGEQDELWKTGLRDGKNSLQSYRQTLA
jgi:hypothetical protein